MSVTIERLHDFFGPFLLSGDADDELEDANRLETIVRTNVIDAYNHGRLTEFLDPSIVPYLDGVRYSAILDNRTTPVCDLLHDKVFKLDDVTLHALLPPNHFNCRSLITPVVVGQKVRDADWITPAEAKKALELADQRFLAEWDESKHPRHPSGDERGGEFRPKGTSYHGTVEAIVEKIKKEGLKVGKSGYVFSTTDKEQALGYALERTSAYFKGRVRVPEGTKIALVVLKKNAPLEFHPATIHSRVNSEYRISRKGVGSEHIARVEFYDYKLADEISIRGSLEDYKPTRILKFSSKSSDEFFLPIDLTVEFQDGLQLLAFNPNQPRHPQGHPDGGQWSDEDESEYPPLTAEKRKSMTAEELEEYKRKYNERKRKREAKRKGPFEDGGGTKEVVKVEKKTTADRKTTLGDFIYRSEARPDSFQIDRHLKGMEINGQAIASRLAPEHGMSTSEEMYLVQLDKMTISYPRTDRGRIAAAATLRNLSRGNYPPELTEWTTEITLTAQKNKQDATWAQTFNRPGFTSEATGGNGGMVVYNGGSASGHTLSHEMGHNLAKGLYYTTHPGSDSPLAKNYRDWKNQLPGAEAPVSAYGKYNVAEAYAEAVSWYFTQDRITMKQVYPKQSIAVEAELATSRKKLGLTK